MKQSLSDNLLSFIFYYTFGIFALVLLIFCSVTKKQTSDFLRFHIYQSLFIAVILACISSIYSFLLNLILNFPIEIVFLKKALLSFDLFLNRTPIFFTFSLTGLVVFLVVSYLAIFALLGKKSYLPYISDVVDSYFRT